MPAIKSLSILAAATTPKMIIGRLGGNNKPKLPDEVTRPSEYLSPYFSDNKAGSKNPPNATIVTPEAPVKAVKIEQAKIVTIASEEQEDIKKLNPDYFNLANFILVTPQTMTKTY